MEPIGSISKQAYSTVNGYVVTFHGAELSKEHDGAWLLRVGVRATGTPHRIDAQGYVRTLSELDVCPVWYPTFWYVVAMRLWECGAITYDQMDRLRDGDTSVLV